MKIREKVPIKTLGIIIFSLLFFCHNAFSQSENSTEYIGFHLTNNVTFYKIQIVGEYYADAETEPLFGYELGIDYENRLTKNINLQSGLDLIINKYNVNNITYKYYTNSIDYYETYLHLTRSQYYISIPVKEKIYFSKKGYGLYFSGGMTADIKILYVTKNKIDLINGEVETYTEKFNRFTGWGLDRNLSFGAIFGIGIEKKL